MVRAHPGDPGRKTRTARRSQSAVPTGMGRWQSGRLRLAVTQLRQKRGGSNPSLPTKTTKIWRRLEEDPARTSEILRLYAAHWQGSRRGSKRGRAHLFYSPGEKGASRLASYPWVRANHFRGGTGAAGNIEASLRFFARFLRRCRKIRRLLLRARTTVPIFVFRPRTARPARAARTGRRQSGTETSSTMAPGRTVRRTRRPRPQRGRWRPRPTGPRPEMAGPDTGRTHGGAPKRRGSSDRSTVMPATAGRCGRARTCGARRGDVRGGRRKGPEGLAPAEEAAPATARGSDAGADAENSQTADGVGRQGGEPSFPK